MLNDLLVACVLLLVGLVAALATGRSRYVVDILRAALAGMWRSLRHLSALWTHRCLRLACLVILAISASWSATIAQSGWAETRGSLGHGPAPQDIRYCKVSQRMMHGQVLHKIRDGQWDPHKLPYWIRDSCPNEGEIFVDEEGYLSCTLHGRGPDQPPVWSGQPVPRRKSRGGLR